MYFCETNPPFLECFLMQPSSREKLVSEMHEEFWWFRFGKRTHRRGVNRGVLAENEPIFRGFRSDRWRPAVE